MPGPATRSPDEKPGAEAGQGPARGPLSMERILGILASVAADPGGKSLTRLSAELGTPKTSLLNLLPGLTASGYLTRAGHAYRLGPKAFQLATTILHARRDVASIAKPLLQRLAEDTGKTVTLCVLAPDERAILHVAKEEARAAMRFAVEVGERAPLHTTAAGRVILAFRPGEWAERFLQHARLEPHTARTITDREQLRASVQEVRRVGVAITRGETYETVGAVAAPVFSSEGFLGAVVVAGAVERVIAQSGELGALVRGTADELSTMMGRA
jgi:IclR family acetate operon transcriptional repressor